MKALLIGLSILFVYFFVKFYFRFKRFNKGYKAEYVKILTNDEFKVKGKFE